MQTSEIQFIDTHCHLYSAEFDADRHEMVRRSIDAGISRMMMPNIDQVTFEPMLELSRQFPLHCFPMIGLHPCSVKNGFEQQLEAIKRRAVDYEFIGIGETGVDLYWDQSTRDIQIEAFEEQIRWGNEMDLPVIIHSRESLDLNIEIIARHQNGGLRGIFHCFGGSLDQALRIHALGFKIGIGGIITFKKNELAAILPRVPEDMIVLETDAPYLAPVPFRGKRNESSYLRNIAEHIAVLVKLSLQDLAELTTSNAVEVFGKKG